MKVDITQLLTVFDGFLTSLTDEEQGAYWFRLTRADGLRVTLSLSIYEWYATVLICNKFKRAIASVDMYNCSEIKVLDEKNKILEITHGDSLRKCLLQLTGDNILTYDEAP